MDNTRFIKLDGKKVFVKGKEYTGAGGVGVDNTTNQIYLTYKTESLKLVSEDGTDYLDTTIPLSNLLKLIGGSSQSVDGQVLFTGSIKVSAISGNSSDRPIIINNGLDLGGNEITSVGTAVGLASATNLFQVKNLIGAIETSVAFNTTSIKSIKQQLIGIIDLIGQWDPNYNDGNGYSIGNIVGHSRKAWLSIVNNNTSEPKSYSSTWIRFNLNIDTDKFVSKKTMTLTSDASGIVDLGDYQVGDIIGIDLHIVDGFYLQNTASKIKLFHLNDLGIAVRINEVSNIDITFMTNRLLEEKIKEMIAQPKIYGSLAENRVVEETLIEKVLRELKQLEKDYEKEVEIINKEIEKRNGKKDEKH